MSLTGTFVALGAQAQSVEKPDVTFMLDWTIGGTHAPFFMGLEKGYYADEGLNVKIDRGTGAGNTANSVASGAYDFGWADVTTMIGFDAQNPESPLTLVYISFQDSPLAVISLKKAGIETLADLEGKNVADQPGSAGGSIINFLTKPGTPEEIKFERTFTSPQLREPMVVRGEVDAALGFDVSTVLSLVGLGVPIEDINILRYSDIGFDTYGTGVWVSKDFLEENPNTVAAMVRAINKGTKDAIADPRAAAEMMKKYNPVLDPDVEYLRLLMALDHTLGGDVKEKGLSDVDPERMQKTIDLVVEIQGYDDAPALETVWTDAFLPEQAERMPPPLGE